MERLTRKDAYGFVQHPWEFNGVNGSYDIRDEEILAKQIERLAAYEDTGLEPEEIYEVRFLIAAQRDPQKLARLRELVLADQNGRLVVLPCKSGEYWRDWNGERVRIESVSFSQSRRHLCNTDMVTYRYDDVEDDFAVNWIYFKSHFTREEAEVDEKGGEG